MNLGILAILYSYISYGISYITIYIRYIGW